MIKEIMNEETPESDESPLDSTDIMDNPFDDEEQEESITLKLKKEFKEYELYDKHVREL